MIAIETAQHIERISAGAKTSWVVVAADGRVLACVVDKDHQDDLPLAEINRATLRLPLVEISFSRCRRSDSRTPRALCTSLLQEALDGVKLVN